MSGEVAVVENTIEACKQELVDFLNYRADFLLTADGLEQAMYNVKRFLPNGGIEDLFKLSIEAAMIASESVEHLADYAESLDISDMDKLLDMASINSEYRLYNPELVKDIKRMPLTMKDYVIIAAADMIGISIYGSLRCRVKEINEKLEEGN